MKKPPTLFDEVYQAAYYPKGDHRGCVLVDREADLRRDLRDARRFVLDAGMSSFLVDLSTAAFLKYDKLEKRNTKTLNRLIEQLRVQSRIPHRLTWIEFDMVAAAIRAHEMGLAQTKMTAEELRIAYHKPRRQGWLLNEHPTNDTHFRCHIFDTMEESERVICTPFSFTWVTDDQPWSHAYENAENGMTISELALGVMQYKTDRVSIGTSEYLSTSMQTMDDLPMMQESCWQQHVDIAQGWRC